MVPSNMPNRWLLLAAVCIGNVRDWIDRKRAAVFNAFARWVIAKAAKRDPDVLIGGRENPYLLRWWLIPRNRWFNVYLHQFKRSDDDRALHDHSWINASIVLTEPGYTEVSPLCPREMKRKAGVFTTMVKRTARPAGSIVVRRATAAHRLELHRDSGGEISIWSLFLTLRVKRTWGFWCPRGWRKWHEFVENTTDANGQITSKVGRGCD